MGPTHDDVTKKAFCKIFSDEMYLDEDYFSLLKKRFEGQRKNMPIINRSQAMMLKKADIIPNDSGSALGMHYLENNTHVFIMPGVPDEMKGMVQNYIIPDYMKNEPATDQVTIKTAGIMESRLAEKIEALMKKYSTSFRYAFLPHYTGVSFRIREKNKTEISIKNINLKRSNDYKKYLLYPGIIATMIIIIFMVVKYFYPDFFTKSFDKDGN